MQLYNKNKQQLYISPQHFKVLGAFLLMNTCSDFTTSTSIFHYKETFIDAVDLYCSKEDN